MVELAETHCQMGIRTIEYGIVGEVLFWTLHRLLGSQAYNREVEIAWTRIFSSMLRIIVPIAVTFERDQGRSNRASVRRAEKSSVPANVCFSSFHPGNASSVVALYEKSLIISTNAMSQQMLSKLSAGVSSNETVQSLS